MFSDITFYVKGKTIEVDGQDFLLGELTESCLNITPDEYHELKDKHKKLKDMIVPEKLNENLDEKELDLWIDKLFEIDSLLRRHKIFQVIGASVKAIRSLVSSDDILEKTIAFLPLVLKYGLKNRGFLLEVKKPYGYVYAVNKLRIPNMMFDYS